MIALLRSELLRFRSRRIVKALSIVAHGRMVASGRTDEVLSAGRATRLIVRLEDARAGLEALTGAGFAASAVDGVLRVEAPPVMRTAMRLSIVLTP